MACAQRVATLRCMIDISGAPYSNMSQSDIILKLDTFYAPSIKTEYVQWLFNNMFILQLLLYLYLFVFISILDMVQFLHITSWIIVCFAC